jgi:iron complex outermembrane receptor protein
LGSQWVLAEQAESGGGSTVEEAKLQEVIIQGSRLPTEVQTMPQSVVVLSAEDIQTQASMSSDMQTILADLVPGLSRSSISTLDTFLSLRGRKPVILVDGIPVTSTLNDTGREVNLIDPSLIERVEVVPGSSALYGQSEGAGFINYITKGGEPGPLNLYSEVGTGLTLTHISGDSFMPEARQTVSGTVDDFDYRAGAYYEQINSLFDADGKRLPAPIGDAINDSWIHSGYGKVGYTFGDQRLEASVNYYKQQSTIHYGLVNGNIALGTPATAVPAAPQPGEVPQYNQSFIGNLVYANSAVFGTRSSFRAQLFYDQSFSIFQYTANRFPLVVPLGESPNGQSENDTHKRGARIDINTPLDSFLPLSGSLQWGVDFLRDRTVIPLVDGRQFGIPQTLKSYAGFVEVQLKPIDPLVLTVGVRRESDTIDVDNFFSLFTLAQITGGALHYSTTPINAGVVYSITKAVDFFAGFSQGFDIQQTSQNFRSWPVNINLARTQPPANVIDSYESGLRFHGNGFEASATEFLTHSSEGVSYVYNSVTPADPVAQVAPDHVWGTELKVDYTGIERWKLGASYARMEGSAATGSNGVYNTWLNDRRIPPPSLNVYMQWAFAVDSTLRLQTLYSDNRNRFPNAAPNVFYEGPVHPYTQTDAMARIGMGRYGEWNIGIQNLFNRNYFTNFSEGYNANNNYIKAQGRALTLRYGIHY